jgi:hypothetical protein
MYPTRIQTISKHLSNNLPTKQEHHPTLSANLVMKYGRRRGNFVKPR